MNLVADTIIQLHDQGSGPSIHAEKPPGRDEITLTVTDHACRLRWYGTADQFRGLFGALLDAVDDADSAASRRGGRP